MPIGEAERRQGEGREKAERERVCVCKYRIHFPCAKKGIRRLEHALDVLAKHCTPCSSSIFLLPRSQQQR